jgi:putative membrane protein
MKTRLLLASLATATAMAFALPALAADSAQDFVNKAAAGGMFEVDSSKVAETKVQDQSIKDFAHKMIDDHGAANAKLETIAGEQKLTVPKELDAKHKARIRLTRPTSRCSATRIPRRSSCLKAMPRTATMRN